MGILNDETIDTRTAFDRLFAATAREFTRSDLPLGCMISLAGTHVPPGRKAMRKLMAEHRAGSKAASAARLRKGVEDGDLPPDTDVDAMAAYYNAVALGLAIQARDGAPRERLAEIGRIAMRAWPTTSRKNATKCRGE